MARVLHDHFFRLAKREGYLSRAAYKLIEINERKKILNSGDRVLDAGAAPGSWTQVAAKMVGDRGRVVAVDLEPMQPAARRPNVVAITGDLLSVTAATIEAAGGVVPFDVILSDLAPRTTGQAGIDHHASVRLTRAIFVRCAAWLRPGGRLVCKVFEGEEYPELLRELSTQFEKGKGYKPAASRAISREMYLIGHGYVPPVAPPDSPPDDGDKPVKRGWR